MQLITIFILSVLSLLFGNSPLDPNNCGVYQTLEDFNTDHIIGKGKYIKADITGYWVEFMDNGVKNRIKAKESNIWGYKDMYGFRYRNIEGKFYPIIESGPIILYSNRTLPKQIAPGLWEIRTKPDWLFAARNFHDIPIPLFQIRNKNIIADWMEQEGESLQAAKLRNLETITPLYAAEKMYNAIQLFNRSKQSQQAPK